MKLGFYFTNRLGENHNYGAVDAITNLSATTLDLMQQGTLGTTVIDIVSDHKEGDMMHKPVMVITKLDGFGAADAEIEDQLTTLVGPGKDYVINIDKSKNLYECGISVGAKVPMTVLEEIHDMIQPLLETEQDMTLIDASFQNAMFMLTEYSSNGEVIPSLNKAVINTPVTEAPVQAEVVTAEAVAEIVFDKIKDSIKEEIAKYIPESVLKLTGEGGILSEANIPKITEGLKKLVEMVNTSNTANTQQDFTAPMPNSEVQHRIEEIPEEPAAAPEVTASPVVSTDGPNEVPIAGTEDITDDQMPVISPMEDLLETFALESSSDAEFLRLAIENKEKLTIDQIESVCNLALFHHYTNGGSILAFNDKEASFRKAKFNI